LKLLLDEHISSVVAEQLRGRGHDVVVTTEVGLAGRGDPEILSWAASEGRAVVTNNIKDFRPLHASYLTMGTVHHGIVLVPTSKYSLRLDQLGPLITALDKLLVQWTTDDALRDTEHFL
jgi:predicted nuclease of predicted toxin-antitoxin system